MQHDYPLVKPVGLTHALVWAWVQPVTSPLERVVLLWWATESAGGGLTPTKERMHDAARTCVASPGQVREVLSRLTQRGLLVDVQGDLWVEPAVIA